MCPLHRTRLVTRLDQLDFRRIVPTIEQLKVYLKDTEFEPEVCDYNFARNVDHQDTNRNTKFNLFDYWPAHSDPLHLRADILANVGTQVLLAIFVPAGFHRYRDHLFLHSLHFDSGLQLPSSPVYICQRLPHWLP